jgi:cytochrome o ubiquinol oxidase subunit 2
VPVFALTFYIAWKYRASNKKARYTPDWDHHTGIEALWWAIPLALITILSVITYKTSHELDPFRPIASDKKPLTVQVVALQWKWLFIYPEQNIASVNFVQFPEDRPVNFQITSDAPMNSFWIPQLGGQMYAMSGMNTKLHLIADEPGTFRGSSANISGEGFSDMVFSAKATSEAEFDEWVREVKEDTDYLDMSAYGELAEPDIPKEVLYYGSVERSLYDKVVDSYMPHSRGHDETHHTEGQ